MRRTVLWVLAAVAGVLLVAGVTAAASSLSTQTIGLSSEPLSAGEQLTPRATAEATATATPKPRKKARKQPKPAATPTPTPAATAVPTVDDHGGGDDHGGSHGGGSDDNSGHGGSGGDDD